MGLRETAAADAQTLLGDLDGFGQAITLRSPEGVEVELVGYSNDIAETIDPQTGMVVIGRSASVALSILALDEAGLGMPRGVASSSSAPWVVSFSDQVGNVHVFKVTESRPDRALGVVTCVLEAYRPNG